MNFNSRASLKELSGPKSGIIRATLQIIQAYNNHPRVYTDINNILLNEWIQWGNYSYRIPHMSILSPLRKWSLTLYALIIDCT